MLLYSLGIAVGIGFGIIITYVLIGRKFIDFLVALVLIEYVLAITNLQILPRGRAELTHHGSRPLPIDVLRVELLRRLCMGRDVHSFNNILYFKIRKEYNK